MGECDSENMLLCEYECVRYLYACVLVSVCVCVCVVGREGGGTLVRTLGSFFGCVLFSFLTPPIASGSSQAGDPTRATEVTMLDP